MPSPGPKQDVALDDIDAEILRLLRRDSRMPIVQLAGKANVSRATAYARLTRLVETGVVKRFTVQVDPDKMGLSVAALIHISVKQAHWRTVREKLLTLPGAERLLFTSGALDLVLLVRVRDIETLRDVVLEQVHRIPEVESTQTAFVLDEYEPDT